MMTGFCTALQAAARLQAETVLGACSSIGSQGVLSAWLPAHLPDLLSAMPSNGRGKPWVPAALGSHFKSANMTATQRTMQRTVASVMLSVQQQCISPVSSCHRSMPCSSRRVGGSCFSDPPHVDLA